MVRKALQILNVYFIILLTNLIKNKTIFLFFFIES